MMLTLLDSMKAKATRYLEEKITLGAFHSAEALKNEIGSRVAARSKEHWSFVELTSRGPYLLLTFSRDADPGRIPGLAENSG